MYFAYPLKWNECCMYVLSYRDCSICICLQRSCYIILSQLVTNFVLLHLFPALCNVENAAFLNCILLLKELHFSSRSDADALISFGTKYVLQTWNDTCNLIMTTQESFILSLLTFISFNSDVVFQKESENKSLLWDYSMNSNSFQKM